MTIRSVWALAILQCPAGQCRPVSSQARITLNELQPKSPTSLPASAAFQAQRSMSQGLAFLRTFRTTLAVLLEGHAQWRKRVRTSWRLRCRVFRSTTLSMGDCRRVRMTTQPKQERISAMELFKENLIMSIPITHYSSYGGYHNKIFYGPIIIIFICPITVFIMKDMY